MPSRSLQIWRTDAAAELDEIESAHRLIGGSGRGRRYATQQINQAYVVLLSSKFQAYCRNLHSEAADFLGRNCQPRILGDILLKGLTRGRTLDERNPTPGNLGADFNRLDLEFWNTLYALDSRNQRRNHSLERLNLWRNAIAHQDFGRPALGGRTTVRLQEVRAWRSALNQLAEAFDRVLRDHLTSMVGTAPWA